MIKDGNNEVDIVCAGLVIMIIGLLLIQCAPILSDISYSPGEKTTYEDKTTRFPDYIAPQAFIIMGIFTIIIGCAVFLRNFINQCHESLIQSEYIESIYNTQKDNKTSAFHI